MQTTSHNTATAALPDVMRVPDVAEFLQTTPWTIYRLVKSGRLDVVRVGGHLRFTRDQVERFVNGS